MTDLAEGTEPTGARSGAAVDARGDAPDRSPFGLPAVTTVPEAIERMEAIQAWVEAGSPRGANDGIACFNFLYQVITRRVLEWIDGGKFHDADFLTRLDVAFANRYFDALRAHEVDPDRGAPRSWDALFDRRSQERIAPMQFAVAGVNAHVNFDLPLAVVATCDDLERSPDTGTQRVDYDKVNLIFAEEMESLRQHFEGRLELWIDENVLGHVDDVLGNFSVEKARDTAWANAEIVWSVRNLDGVEHLFVESLDRIVGFAGRGLLVHL